MKVEMIKLAGGILTPASENEAERLKRFKNQEQYTVELKTTRSPSFHRKAFAFFNFCFDHWKSNREFADEYTQRDYFRKEMTIQAGFYNEVWSITGELTLEAKSLSFASMEQEEFERCYSALINVALRNIFKTDDANTMNQLMSFF